MNVKGNSTNQYSKKDIEWKAVFLCNTYYIDKELLDEPNVDPV